MQAVVVRAWGGTEVLKLERVPDPEPKPGEVVVALCASAVNWHDVIVRRGARRFPLPRILGIDGAGRRRDTGEEVVILPSLRWGVRDEAPGPDFEILGDRIDGTYAELVCVPVENVVRKPAALSWEEAAALPVAGLTAYRALFTRARLRSTDTVLVLGAGGGVSTLAISLASSVGARVIVTSSSREKIARACELGAAAGVLYTDGDWIDEIRGMTGGGADVVLDGMGARIQDSLACLQAGGRLVVFGASGGATAEIDVPQLYFSQRTILGTTLGNAREFASLMQAVERDRIRPAIDGVAPLSEIRTSHERMESGQQFGKLVLTHG